MRGIKDYATTTAVIGIGMAILISIVLLLRGIGTPPQIGEHELPEVQEPDPEANANDANLSTGEVINLRDPEREEGLPVEAALQDRRSVRDYADKSLSIGQISQLLWSAQGISDTESGFRTAPSAGATYPLEIYLVSAGVTNLDHGVYQYEPSRHQMRMKKAGDLRDDLYEVALQQAPVREAPVLLVISAFYERTTGRYGERGERYVHMEAGHAAQNLYLQAESLDLGMVVIGAFDERGVSDALDLAKDEIPLYIIPVGHPGR